MLVSKSVQKIFLEWQTYAAVFAYYEKDDARALLWKECSERVEVFAMYDRIVLPEPHINLAFVAFLANEIEQQKLVDSVPTQVAKVRKWLHKAAEGMDLPRLVASRQRPSPAH